jgi:hypothetical protein
MSRLGLGTGRDLAPLDGRSLTAELLPAGADATGRPQFRLRNINGELITETFTRTAATADGYRVQLGLRYLF